MHATKNFCFTAVAGEFEVIIGLDAHPKFGRHIEQASEFEGHFRAHGALAPDDFADGNGGGSDGLGHGVVGQAQRLHEVLTEHVARMNGVEPVFAYAHNIFNGNYRIAVICQDRVAANKLLKKELMNSPYATFCLGLGSATVPVAAVGVPPTAFRAECFRPEAESGGRDARAPKKFTPSRLDWCR